MAVWVILAAAWVLGAAALRRFRFGDTVEGLTYRFGVGLCLCAILVLVAGSLSLRAAQVLLYVVAVTGLGYEVFIRSRREEPRERFVGKGAALTRLERAYLGVLGGVLLLSLIAALAPVTSWDAVEGHLALAQDYARDGRINLLESNDYSGYPHLVHCLLAYAYFESGETAATLLNCAFGILGCAAVFVLGRRIEGWLCGLIAAAIFATAPIYIDQVGGASLDLAFAAISVAALASLMVWYEEEQVRWLVLGAFLAGSSCGIRHTGYLVCALLALGVLVAASPSRKQSLAWFCGVTFVAAMPWFVRSAVLTGNPVYPFFSSLFATSNVPAEEVANLGTHNSVRGIGPLHLLRFPWDIIMWPNWYDGWSKSPGGLMLFLGVPGVLIGGKRVRWLVGYSVLGGLCFFFFRQNARYLLPFFAPMMVVAAVAACRLPRYYRRLFNYLPALLLAAFAYGLILDLAAVHFKVPVVLGLQDREEYLNRRVERYAAFRWVNENLENSGVILTLDPRSYYLKRPSYQNREALKLLRGKPFTQQLAWLQERNVTHLFFPRTHVDESRGFLSIGIPGIVYGWLDHPGHFRCIESFDLLRPKQDGIERVEVYEVHYATQ